MDWARISLGVKIMQAHRIETIVQPNGKIVLENLPFNEGEKVEIIVLETQTKTSSEKPLSLRGTLLKYDEPFEPATAIENWEASK